MMRKVLLGMAAGAAGTAALNIVTYGYVRSGPFIE
jgi:hypothetical protein